MKTKEKWQVEIEKYDKEAQRRENEYRKRHIHYGTSDDDLKSFLSKNREQDE